MFELVRNLQSNLHIAVTIVVDAIANVSNKLSAIEGTNATILFRNMLLLSFAGSEFFGFVLVYSVAESGGGAVSPTRNIGSPSFLTACPFSIR